MGDAMFDRHRGLLERAVSATTERGWFSGFVDPSAAAEAASNEDEEWRDTHFPLSLAGASRRVSTERSPYGFHLGVTYDAAGDLGTLLASAATGTRAWRDAGAATRFGIALEALDRLHRRGREIAWAVQHTSGQPPRLAWDISVVEALDRGLEALAWLWVETSKVPHSVRRPVAGTPGRRETEYVETTYTVVSRGISLVIGSHTSATWSAWPAIFASLAAGNPVVVQPHRSAVLPLAITVHVIQGVLEGRGFDPNLVTLAPAEEGDRLAERLAVRPEVRLIDFTGAASTCQWLEQRAEQAVLFTGSHGVNCVIVDSTDDFDAMCANLARSLAVYSGQMLSAPQNLLVPREGVATDRGRKSPSDVAEGIGAALADLLRDSARAADILGALCDPMVGEWVDRSAAAGELLVAGRTLRHPDHPGADVRTPAIVGLTAFEAEARSLETFGPIAHVISTRDTEEALALCDRLADQYGAVTAAVYTTSEEVLADVRDVAREHAIPLSENLLGIELVNALRPFSDFHGAGTAPASSATIVDAAFVTPRFRVAQSRRQL